MNYAKYFHTDQKVSLKVAVKQEGEVKQFDSLFGLVVDCTDRTLTISFPPPHEHHSGYPFSQDQEIEVLSDRHGMGFSATTLFLHKLDNEKSIELECTGDLNYFNRRRHQRIDMQLWIGMEKCVDSIAVMKGRWQQLAEHFRGDNPSPNITDFSKREVSLSASGMGIHEENLSTPGGYFLIFLALDNEKQIICILGEVVRTNSSDKVKFSTGVHFDCILEEDRKRIEKFVNQHCTKE